MKPILFPPDATVFTTHGLGTLSDCTTCPVTEERNGIFELELSYPISGVQFGHIQQRSIILAKPDNFTAPQPFRVYRISRPIGGVVKVYARHISYDLSGYPVRPYSASNAQTAVAGLKQYAVKPSPFSITTDLTGTGAFDVGVPTATRALFGGTEGSLIDLYGGEWQYDGFNCRLLKSRGQDRGFKILYGKNLTDLKQEENCSKVYTAILPYYAPPDGYVITGDVISAVKDAEYTKILSVDLTQSFDDTPTEAQLTTAGQTYLKTHAVGVPTVSLSVSFVSLRGSDDYEGDIEDVRLCDTVTVKFDRLGVDTKAKVVKTVYDCVAERLVSVEIGSIRTSIADTIAETAKEISTKPGTNAMLSAIASMTAAILGAKGGSIRFLDTDGDGELDTLYMADGPNPATAKKVWRFNYEGWGASENGFNGPFVLGVTFEGGGTFNCANMNVININGENILGKTIGNTALGDGAAVERVIGTNAVINRCIASGSVYTSTCNAEIQGYFADIIETRKLYAGTASVGFLRAQVIKADEFALTNGGTPHKLIWNGVGNPITGG